MRAVANSSVPSSCLRQWPLALLAAVQEVLDTKTLKDTIEHAFLEVLRARAREEEVAALSSLSGMDLDNDEVMAEAKGFVERLGAGGGSLSHRQKRAR